jgi:trigger factor
MAEIETGRSDLRVESNVLSAVVRELAIEIEPKRVDAAFSRVVQNLRKQARVKGFRPGKAPASVIKQMYGPALGEEIERSLVHETLADAVELAELVPVVEPQIEAGIPEEGKAFRYTARIEVKPEIELPELSALSGSRPRVAVGEADVLSELENLREQRAEWIEEPEETEAESGHQVTIDFVGRIDDVAFEGGTAEGVDLELGSGRMIPGFEEGLLGAKSGEERDLNVSFPEEYGNAELSGKAAVFASRVTAIKRRELPELDDDFAKDLGDFETLGDVQDKIRENLREHRKHTSDQALHRSLLDDLLARTSFEVPPSLVERQLENQLQQVARQLQHRIPEPELRARIAQLREEGWDEAKRRVQEALLLESIAKSAELEASDAEIEARLEEMATSQGVDVKTMRDMANAQGWRPAIAGEIVDRKTMALIEESAQITEVEPSEDA